MARSRNVLLWVLLFLGMSCTDLSSVCKHLQRPVSIASATPLTAEQQAAKIVWKTLADVSFKAKFNKEFQMDFMYPVFGPGVRRLEGKELIISGYMIPLDVKAGLYAVSEFTYASCFFCGAAGVESVVSLKFADKPRRFRTDEFRSIQGRLELNSTNVNDFIYVFRDAKLAD